MEMRAFNLNDKYTLTEGEIYLTGIQALARLALIQKQRDLEAGLNTGGFISGYRGSPLGTLDKELWSIKDLLKSSNIVFQPGVNEDLAATAVWGSQQNSLNPDANVDGVFGLWYGKGPGVDRSGDVLKHANAAGTSQTGGVLLCMGDDHTAKSSTLAHQSEFALMDAGIPVLNPSSIQEILDYGLYGWAMSRYSGCWVGLKTISETMDSSASVNADSHRVQIITPHDFEIPADGVHIRTTDTPLEQEARLHKTKLYAAIAFAQANGLNRIVFDSPDPKLGIITTGKSYLDVRQALSDLGIDGRLAHAIGIRLYKIGMPWPLDKLGVNEFAEGLDEILVVEEKRALMENQLKEQLYNCPEEQRPRVVGKCDEQGDWLLPSTEELTPARIARVIADRIGRYVTSEPIRDRLAFLEAKEKALQHRAISLIRKPHFCSGCPHNTSTRVPEGSRATAGIGCHYMVLWMDRKTSTFTQMGGEGTPWIGQAPFCETPHIFVNLGDGTYFHSGSLAIRAAIAAGVNVSYKILYNSAVAMTGGQMIDGELSLPQLTQQLFAEGVKQISVVSENPDHYVENSGLAAGTDVHSRADFDTVQKSLRETKGVSVLIYDQMCATEKRRQIKRGKLQASKTYAYINTDICENCGDCSLKSNCLAVVPIETSLGRKRQIDQAACNHDFSCINGFCPSFVTIKGKRKPAKDTLLTADTRQLSEPQLPSLKSPYAMVITGIGGTGIVTLSAILGVAAHLDGRGINVLDMTGMAQKFGAVSSHIQIAKRHDEIHATRIAAGHADLLLGCDAITASSADSLAKLDRSRSYAVINDYAAVTSDFLNDPDRQFPVREIHELIGDSIKAERTWFFNGTHLAEKACGNPIASNMLMVGYAWQRGLIPLSRQSIEQAISINGTAIDMNIQAFNWGRCLASDPDKVIEQLGLKPSPEPALDEIISHRCELLADYQDQKLAETYKKRIDKLRAVESDTNDGEELSHAAAQQYARLLMIKDEFEVARLLTSHGFKTELEAQFEQGYETNYLLAPPLFSRSKDKTKDPDKMSFGDWLTPVLRFVAGKRKIRNSRLDPFRYSTERKIDLALLKAYEALLEHTIESLNTDNQTQLLQQHKMAEQVRGFGQMRIKKAQEVMANWSANLNG